MAFDDLKQMTQQTAARPGTAVRNVVRGERLTVTRVEMKRGAVTATHSHENEEVVIVLEGAWRFHLPPGAVTVTPNQILCIPARTEHFQETLLNTVALVVSTPPQADARPPAEDFSSNDPDQYLWGV